MNKAFVSHDFDGAGCVNF